MVLKDRAMPPQAGIGQPWTLTTLEDDRTQTHAGDASGVDGAKKVVARHERPRGAASHAEIRG